MQSNNNESYNNIDYVINIVQAMGELFISLHLFDLQKNKIYEIKSNDKINKLSKKCDTPQELVTNIMEKISIPETLDSIKDFTTLSTLQDRLEDKKVVSQLFCDKNLGWCNIVFIRLNNEEPLRYVLCGIQSLDKEVKRAEEIELTNIEKSKFSSIVDSLMKEYTTVCSIDLSDDSIEFLRTVPRSEAVKRIWNNDIAYSKLIKYYLRIGIDKRDLKDTREFLKISSLKRLDKGSSKSLVYRNEYGEYGKAKIIRTGINHILLGIREKNLDIEELRGLLFNDSLTKAKNRKYFDEELIDDTSRGLIIADIDHFRNINNTLGHQVGDRILIEITKVLKSCLRQSDYIIRYEGDKFVIAFRYITKEALEHILEEMKNAVQRIKVPESPLVKLSMSFGAVYGDSTVRNMLHAAEEALYISKETRNTITINEYGNRKVLTLEK